MLTACGRVHRTCLADLREALQPRLALPDRQAKGAPKGDRGKGRNGSTTTTDQDEGKTRKRKGRDGGKRKRKGKGDRGESTERATKKKKGEHTTQTQAPTDTKGNGKTRKPKSEIPCRRLGPTYPSPATNGRPPFLTPNRPWGLRQPNRQYRQTDPRASQPSCYRTWPRLPH